MYPASAILCFFLLLIVFGILFYYTYRSKSKTTEKLKAFEAKLSRQKIKLSETLESLADSKSRYKNLVENSPIGILLLDTRGNILEVNNKMLEILGSPGSEETRSINCLEFPPLKKIGLVDNILNCIKGGEPLSSDGYYETKWGKKVHLNYRIIPLKDKAGQVTNLILNVDDISASLKAERSRFESELKYRILVENSLQAMLIVQGGRVIFANPKMGELTRYSEEEIKNAGRRWLNLLIHPEDKRRSFKNVRDALAGNEFEVNAVYKIIRKDGESRIMETLSSVVDFQEKAAMLIVAIDITESAKAQNELIESEKRLREVNAMKDKFFSIIAHDLKNPFSSILGFSNLLNEAYENFSEKQRKTFIKNICEASENTYKLLQNLLEWSKTQTGKIEFIPKNLEVETLVKDNISVLKSGFIRKNIAIHTEIPNGAMVFADENMLNLVIRNLMSNALKFTYPGGKIDIVVKNNQNETIITVKDNGIGIDDKNLNRLFRIDDQLKTDGTANESGSGLGLILCKEFVEKNKGRIWVQSSVGEGSSFSFSLPTSDVQQNQEESL